MGVRCGHGWSSPARAGTPGAPLLPGVLGASLRPLERDPSERIDCGSPPIVTTSEGSPSDVPLVDQATDPAAQREADGAPTNPAALPETDGAARPQDDAHRESIEAADEEGDRSFFSRIGGRAVVIPLACVAAFLVGFGSMVAVLRLGDGPARPDTKTVPTTAPPSLPAVTTAPTTAASAVGASEPTAPAPEPAPAPEAAPAPAPAPPAGASESPPPSSSPPTTVPTTTPTTTGVGNGAPGRGGGAG
jgi:hypothetical protein